MRPIWKKNKDVKLFRTLILVCLLSLSPWIVAGTELISNNPYWFGGTDAFTTTQGNDFWLTFINNNGFDPDKPENQTVKFEMKVAVSAREAVDVNIAYGNTILTTLNVPAGTTQIYEIPRALTQQIYLFESEQNGKSGVHVYTAPTTPENKKKVFSCFLYSRTNDSPITSRDASLVIPTRFLGKEYIIQTYPEDVYSSEFGIVATEDGTTVTITPTFQTDGGNAAGTAFDVTLSKGQAYLVATKRRDEGSTDFNADFSGTTLCADKPIAVFTGNQQTGIPNKEGYSQDFMVEQALPLTQFGTEFYLTGLTNTLSNYADIVALYDNTDVIITTYDKSTGAVNTFRVTLNRGGTLQQLPPDSVMLDLHDELNNEVIIRTSAPVSCISYTSTAAENKICTTVGWSQKCFIYGDPSSAIMPHWGLRTNAMTFFTEVLDPQVNGTPQHFYVYVVTAASDINTFTLNGAPVASSEFHTFQADPKKAYAHLQLPDAASANYNLLESTGGGFVGMVYGITEAQAYYYTLGFKPEAHPDSLYVTHTDEVVMSKASYDLDSLDGHGWYQRQWDEWMPDHEQLDTAIVCDSSFVYWTLETEIERPATQIEWLLFDVTDGKKPTGTPEASSITPPAATATKHDWQYEFILPEEEMEDRHQFFEYELQTVLHRERIMCDGEDLDTLKTTVRVTRIYNDTLYRVVCVGDSLEFFYDSLYNQDNLTLYNPDSAATKFVGVKQGQGTHYLEPWKYQVEVGTYHTFTRNYLSQAGCDSTMTLILFVCDTFQYFDTIHLCTNQDTVYQKRTFRGASLNRDTTEVDISWKTKACECQLGPWADKFRDKRGRPFNGCDSTYHLTLIRHESYVIPFRDTVCLDKDGHGSYTWSIQYETKTRTITESDLSWDPAYGALVGVFRDSMYTQTCAECNGGLHGCDSIHELTLIMPQSYYFDETKEWCKLHYDPVTHDTVRSFFRWEGHRDGAEYVELLTSGDYYDSCHTTRYGCDSIYHLRLDYRAAQELYALTVDTICTDENGTFPWIGPKGEHLEDISLDMKIPANRRCSTIYHSIEAGCDSIYALHLTVMPTFFKIDTVLITEEQVYSWPINYTTYGGSKATEPYDVLVTQDTLVTVSSLTQPIGTHSCDSTHVLFLRIGSVFRDTISDFACGTETSYVWVEDRPEFMPEGVPFERMVITDLPEPGKTQTYEQPFKTVLGFDSVFYLHLYRAPSYRDTVHVFTCQQRTSGSPYIWKGHQGRKIYDQSGNLVPFIPSIWDGDYYYTDTMQTEGYECDSICVLHLHFYPYYDFNKSLDYCQGEPFAWEDLPGNTKPVSIYDDKENPITVIPTDHTGDYQYTLHFNTIHECDSAWHLTLHIDTVYTTPVEITQRVMCDNDTIHFLGEPVYGAKSPLLPEGESGRSVPGETDRWVVFDLSGNSQTTAGCDSAVHHRVTLYRTYFLPEEQRICQGSEFEWHDKEISTLRCGTFVFYDSLKTKDCLVCDPESGECGCDSVYELTLHVDSVYHIYESITLCDYDSITWQGHHFAGPKLENPAAGYRVLHKADTTYGDTVTRLSIHDCDSIHYLSLRVAPSYDTTIVRHVCDNDDSQFAHIYIFQDTHGAYFRDSLEFKPTRSTEGVLKPDITFTPSHLLKTREGCDSLVTYKVIVHPTYRFIDSGRGCAGTAIEWRGKTIIATGTYYDKLKTQDGCDSIYQLDFYVKPFITVPVHDFACDNEIYYHRDTVAETVFETEVWHPGASRPDPDKMPYIEVRFKGVDGCDSIVYNYYLTICPTFSFFAETDGICSGDTFYSEDLNHAWSAWAIEYDVDTFVRPYDTLFIDSLTTVMGCDSIYTLAAHVFPAYRHVTFDTICSNESYLWPGRDSRPDSLLTNLESGQYFLRDSFLTVDGCDSIYEIRLMVGASFISEEHQTLCADDSLDWHGWHIAHILPKDEEYFYYDSAISVVTGCDSVYHLYLTVLDTTMEVRYESICIGDTLLIGDHIYTQEGDYKDTTLNDVGCHHFIYTHLTVIPPTVPTLWVEDAMCGDESAFEVLYTYTSHDPIAYSLYFDSEALEMGFENQIDVPITSYSSPMVISVPIPYRDGDRRHYPRPDIYSITLVLDNGICQHMESDCINDTTLTLSYPKWLTEQRHGDVIAILDSAYNGGYKWRDFQWYEGDSMLVGQTKPYLYLPMGLNVGAEYHVELTRVNEKEAFPTCPIVAIPNPINEDYAPKKGYLAVTPTCIVSANPIAHILSRKDGTFRINTSDGTFVTEGVFRAPVTPITLPSAQGLYIVQLWSNDTPEEPYRAIKVIVAPSCPNCDISSF